MLRKSITITVTMFFLILMASFQNLSSEALAMAHKKQINFEENKFIQVASSVKKKVNIKMKYNIDKLTKAVLENNMNLVRKIIKSNSVNINTKDSQGKYPLEMVLVMNNCNMAKILLKAGADPYVVTSGGKTIYDIVMEEGSESLVKIFKKYDKNKN